MKAPIVRERKAETKVHSAPAIKHTPEEQLPIGAGIANEEVRKNMNIIHKGRSGGIDDNEIENTDLKGFDRSDD